MRILQIGMTDNLGGIESYLINYYRNINKEKVQFDFINIYNQNLCFQDEIEKLGGKVYKVSSYYKHPLKYVNEVKKLIKKNNYEIIHCNMNSAVMLYPLIAAKFAGAKVIIAHSHNNCSDKGILKKILHNVNKHFIDLFANYYFACSREAGEWFFSKKNMAGDNFFVINNPIDINKFVYSERIRKKVKKELHIEDDTFTVGHVGRFTPQKNHDFLIEVFEKFHKMNNNSKLILIGVGELQDKIRIKVKKKNLTNNVIFLNNRNDVNEIMQCMDFFILPSLYEGFGIVLIEAQASGLPILTSLNIPDSVKITDSFHKLPLNVQPEKWARKIKEITIKNRTLDKKLMVFDVDKCSRALENIYYDCLKRKEYNLNE